MVIFINIPALFHNICCFTELPFLTSVVGWKILSSYLSRGMNCRKAFISIYLWWINAKTKIILVKAAYYMWMLWLALVGGTILRVVNHLSNHRRSTYPASLWVGHSNDQHALNLSPLSLCSWMHHLFGFGGGGGNRVIIPCMCTQVHLWACLEVRLTPGDPNWGLGFFFQWGDLLLPALWSC